MSMSNDVQLSQKLWLVKKLVVLAVEPILCHVMWRRPAIVYFLRQLEKVLCAELFLNGTLRSK